MERKAGEVNTVEEERREEEMEEEEKKKYSIHVASETCDGEETPRVAVRNIPISRDNSK